MTNQIGLTRGLRAIVDDEDHERLAQRKWHAVRSRDHFYAANSERMYMHRVILEVGPDQQVIHLNGNGLDNRRRNLRLRWPTCEPVRSDSGIAIPLTQGLFTIIDPEDYELVGRYRWFALRQRGRIYAAATNQETGISMRMHRLILGLKQGQLADHINGDGLDNRRANLRVADRFQNTQNRRIHRNNSSGYKGVSSDFKKNPTRPWRALICVQRKRMLIGYFRSAKEAAVAYDEAAVRYFGQYARTNRMMGLL